jgi:hypothetical protein
VIKNFALTHLNNFTNLNIKKTSYNTGGSKLVNLERSKIEKLSFENTKKMGIINFFLNL